MKYRSIEEMRKVSPVYTGIKMSRGERLKRWADLLEQHDGPVSVLHETEYRPGHVREAMRVDESALAVAFRDPLFRAQGLASDTYGEAVRFFELTDDEAHHIVCHCHYCRESVPAQLVAGRVRAVAQRTVPGSTLQILSWVAGMGAGLTVLGAMALAL